MSKLHLVFGGRVKDPQTLDFDMSTIDVVGIYDSYAAAEDAWRAAAQPSSESTTATLLRRTPGAPRPSGRLMMPR